MPGAGDIRASAGCPMLLLKGKGAAASGGLGRGRGQCCVRARAAGLPGSPDRRDPALNVQPELPVQRLVGFGRVIGSAPEREIGAGTSPLRCLSTGLCKKPRAKLLRSAAAVCELRHAPVPSRRAPRPRFGRTRARTGLRVAKALPASRDSTFPPLPLGTREFGWV